MDQRDLLSAAVADMQSAAPMLSRSSAQMAERLNVALRLLTGEHLDVFTARQALQEVETYVLQNDAASNNAEGDRLLHLLRAADQKLTAALSAGHYSEG